jgi:diacylglycerol kinase (ATP)
MMHSAADCRLAFVAAGTGNDFAKSVGVAADDYAATARAAVDGPDRRVDVGRVENRHFLNCVGFGFDVAVLEAAANVRWLKGSLLYAYAALGQLLRYRGIELAGGDDAAAARRLLFVVANGRWFGGAFQIAPHASCEDGLLDAVAVADSSPLGRIQLFFNALRGSHVRLPAVEIRQARTFSLAFPSPPAYEVDGEYRMAIGSALDIDCLPGALRIVCRHPPSPIAHRPSPAVSRSRAPDPSTAPSG